MEVSRQATQNRIGISTTTDENALAYGVTERPLENLKADRQES
jgi:hypothetical protein